MQCICMPLRVFLMPVCLLLCLPAYGWAGSYVKEYNSALMDRPVVSSDSAAQAVELWAQIDRFTPALDLFNFAAKSGTTSRITAISAYTIGLGYHVNDRLNLRYNFQISDQTGSRTVEPFRVNSRFYRHEARLQYAFYSNYPWRFAVEAGGRMHLGRKESFQRFHTGPALGAGVINVQAGSLNFDNVHGVLSSSNPAFPVLTEQTKDFSYLGAIRGRYEPLPTLDIDFGVEFRRVRISALFSSPSLNHASAIFGNTLLASARNKATSNFPQFTPWHENHVLIQGSLTWHPWSRVTLAGDWTHYQIKRQGFDAKGTTSNFSSSEQFDAYAMMQVVDNLSMYVHGRASTHFVLGDQPLAFNSRTSSKFKNPFGSISAGVVMGF